MTKQEELTYLFGILSEASKWIASADDNRDLVRMEVEERIHNLINGVEPEPDENGLIQSTVHPDVNSVLTEDDYKALEAAKINEHLASVEKVNESRSKWERDKVRVYIDGKHVWKPRAQCVKQPRDNSKGGAPWKWVWIGPQDKKAQEDQMWAEHERS
jgi:hypothetical protein